MPVVYPRSLTARGVDVRRAEICINLRESARIHDLLRARGDNGLENRSRFIEALYGSGRVVHREQAFP